MFKSYEATMVFIDALMSALTGETFESTPARRLTQAVHMLDTPAFSREAIFQGINSDAFTRALEQGAVPYLDPAIIDQTALPAAETDAIEITDDELDESFTEEEIDFPTDEFDHDINEYFKSAYTDRKVIYMTETGAITPDGTIILEGSISMPNKENMLDMDIRFILNPMTNISESINNKNSISETSYKVTNNLSEEIFEFKVSDK